MSPERHDSTPLLDRVVTSKAVDRLLSLRKATLATGLGMAIGLPASIGLINAAVERNGPQWVEMPSTIFLDVARQGDRLNFQKLALAYQASGIDAAKAGDILARLDQLSPTVTVSGRVAEQVRWLAAERVQALETQFAQEALALQAFVANPDAFGIEDYPSLEAPAPEVRADAARRKAIWDPRLDATWKTLYDTRFKADARYIEAVTAAGGEWASQLPQHLDMADAKARLIHALDETGAGAVTVSLGNWESPWEVAAVAEGLLRIDAVVRPPAPNMGEGAPLRSDYGLGLQGQAWLHVVSLWNDCEKIFDFDDRPGCALTPINISPDFAVQEWAYAVDMLNSRLVSYQKGEQATPLGEGLHVLGHDIAARVGWSKTYGSDVPPVDFHWAMAYCLGNVQSLKPAWQAAPLAPPPRELKARIETDAVGVTAEARYRVLSEAEAAEVCMSILHFRTEYLAQPTPPQEPVRGFRYPGVPPLYDEDAGRPNVAVDPFVYVADQFDPPMLDTGAP